MQRLCDKSHMLVGAKVCDLTEDLLWFVCGNFDVFPYFYTHLHDLPYSSL